jgi:hypothetical protein
MSACGFRPVASICLTTSPFSYSDDNARQKFRTFGGIEVWRTVAMHVGAVEVTLSYAVPVTVAGESKGLRFILVQAAASVWG